MRDAPPDLEMTLSSRRRIWGIAVPLVLSAAVQMVFSLTDTWFVGHVSSTAVAALAAVYGLNLSAMLLLGGTSIAVQVVAAQAIGAGDPRRASAAVWSGVISVFLMLPGFVLLGFALDPLLRAIDIAAPIRELAAIYWWPRFVVAGPLWLMTAAFTSFFNATGRSRATLSVTATMAILNIVANWVGVFRLGGGIAGSGWATAAAAFGGLFLAFLLFRRGGGGTRIPARDIRRSLAIRKLFSIGLPIGLGQAADMGAFALVQIMAVGLGAAEGAATQIITTLNGLCYVVTWGLATAGATLVGQAVGRGEPERAAGEAARVISSLVPLLIVMGAGLTLCAPALTWFFIDPTDPSASATAALCRRVSWMAALFQAGDGLAIVLNACLRGAGDVRVPAVLTTALAWGFWVPAALLLIDPSGIVASVRPSAFPSGLAGAWSASILYGYLLAIVLALRWRNLSRRLKTAVGSPEVVH